MGNCCCHDEDVFVYDDSFRTCYHCHRSLRNSYLAGSDGRVYCNYVCQAFEST